MFKLRSYLTAYIVLVIAIMFILMVVPAAVVNAQTDLSTVEPVNLVITDAVLKVSETGMIDVLIDCPAQNCAAIDIELEVDPQQLSLDSIILGEFPSSQTQAVYPLVQNVDPQDGTAHLIYVTEGEYDAASAEAGLLLRINAHALAAGNATVRLSKIQVSDFNGSEVDVASVSSGTVTIEEAEVPQTSTEEEVSQSASHTITMEVKAEARSSETISVWSNQSPQITAVPSSDHNEASLIEISIDADESFTNAVILSAPGHLSCYIPAEQFESLSASVADFLLSAGDANSDGTIDDTDASIVSSHAPQNGDINGDQSVNVLDLIHVGRNYGDTGGQCQ